LNPAYPNGGFQVSGNYSEFLIRRQEFSRRNRNKQEALSTKVKREVEWLRRGPKARTGKSKARIDAAGRLIEQLKDVKRAQRYGHGADRFHGDGAQDQTPDRGGGHREIAGRKAPVREFESHADAGDARGAGGCERQRESRRC
jgi:ATP-binding cassette subfamily F protein uup